MLNLENIRERIDKTDKEIVRLFEERMQIVKEVAEFKISTNKPVLDKEREKEKIAALTKMATDSFNQHGIEELFIQIMAISRKLQYKILAQHGISSSIHFDEVKKIEKQKVKVAFQGVEGAYSQAAMFQYFGDNIESFHVQTFSDAMKAASEQRADYAVLPIENSSAGMVSDVYDLLMEYDVTIVGECYLKVEHALLGLPNAKLSDIRTVYSHPQGLMQCSKYLEQHREWQQISQVNTAVSAKRVVEDGDPSKAAIASALAGNIYGLEVLERGVNDNKNNTTRFIVVSNKKIYKDDANKVSVCFEIAHESGSLYNILSHFIYNNLNMTKIESRPIPGRNWEYRFYVDFEGSLSDSGVKNALNGIEAEASLLKILGNY